MEPEEINVTARKHIEIHRETITPPSREDVPNLLVALLAIARKETVTGKIQVDLVKGGVRSIQAERIEETNSR